MIDLMIQFGQLDLLDLVLARLHLNLSIICVIRSRSAHTGKLEPINNCSPLFVLVLHQRIIVQSNRQPAHLVVEDSGGPVPLDTGVGSEAGGPHLLLSNQT